MESMSTHQGAVANSFQVRASTGTIPSLMKSWLAHLWPAGNSTILRTLQIKIVGWAKNEQRRCFPSRDCVWSASPGITCDCRDVFCSLCFNKYQIRLCRRARWKEAPTYSVSPELAIKRRPPHVSFSDEGEREGGGGVKKKSNAWNAIITPAVSPMSMDLKAEGRYFYSRVTWTRHSLLNIFRQHVLASYLWLGFFFKYDRRLTRESFTMNSPTPVTRSIMASLKPRHPNQSRLPAADHGNRGILVSWLHAAHQPFAWLSQLDCRLIVCFPSW